MSGDEIIALIVSGALGFAGWCAFFVVGLRVRRRPGTSRPALLFATPFLCLAGLFGLLKCYAAEDVRSDPTYLGFYLVLGAAWLAVARGTLAFLGLSARDDVFERENRAAGYAMAGALVGHTLCFAGGNFGNGPGWWVVAFSGGLASLGLWTCWAVLARAARLADRITIDRDGAAGLRAAGFFVGGGLICGRAAAGDWQSASATAAEFAACAWPALVLLMGAIGLEKLVPVAPDSRGAVAVLQGATPAAGYILAGAVVLALVGPW